MNQLSKRARRRLRGQARRAFRQLCGTIQRMIKQGDRYRLHDLSDVVFTYNAAHPAYQIMIGFDLRPRG